MESALYVDFLLHTPRCRSTNIATSSLVMVSQIPSLARTQNQSFVVFVSICMDIGVGIIPISDAQESPRLRDIANPGQLCEPFQTRKGPTWFPKVSVIRLTRPPDFNIRSRSSGSFGFQSVVICTMSKGIGLISLPSPRLVLTPIGSSFNVASKALESPTLPTKCPFSLKYNKIAVVPDA